MFRKINTTTLIIILVILGAIVAFNKFYLDKKSESTFNNQFLKIDSASIKQILIYPKAEQGKEIKLTRQGKDWQLQNGQVTTSANEAMVNDLVKNFTDLKSQALAGNDKASWKEFMIDDTSGSRIKIITTDNKTYDVEVGKLGFEPATRSAVTYLRHHDEDQVYAINGYISFSVNRPFNDWRNKVFIKGNKDDWNKLTFSYPGDSSFVLSRRDKQWTVNGAPADSVKVARYLSTIANIQNSAFVEKYTPVSSPVYTLNIEGNNQAGPITATAYVGDSIQKFVLHSSLNSDAYFADGNNNVVGRVFVGRHSFE